MLSNKLTIHLATDHAGLAHKEAVEDWLQNEGYDMVDHGAHNFDPLDDFTDAILPAAKAVSEDPKNSRGIIFGGSGQGEAMIANRFPHVRATVYYGGNAEIIVLSRKHNNANVLSIGARFVSIDETKKVVWDWLRTDFEGQDKYQRRNEKIDTLTQKNMSIPVVPAIIPKSIENIREIISKLPSAKEVQLDLVDGKFDDDVTWPYEPKGDPMDLKHELDRFTLEIDLMVSEPAVAARAWLAAGADMLVFHVESISLEDFKNFVNGCHCTVGVAAHGDTTVETVAEYAKHADYIQLMGIREIGAQGQPFDESVIGKIEELRRQFPEKVISVDGSVNADTIVRLKKAGVTRMIVGSAIVLEEDPEAAQKKLSELIN